MLFVQVEYQVEECSPENQAKNECIDVKVTKEVIPCGGDIVFGVAHQHSGGIGASLHGQVMDKHKCLNQSAYASLYVSYMKLSQSGQIFI
jgi:hypothetical protein